MTTHEVKYKGNQIFVALTVGTGLTVNGNEQLRLSDTKGDLVVTVPKQIIPWAEPGKVILMAASFMYGEVTGTSNILKPGEVN